MLQAVYLDPLPLNIVADGPVKENKLFGDAFDLISLLSPFLHQADGGQYL
jgi:hypothetical protein